MEHALYRKRIVRIYAVALAIGAAYYALITFAGIKVPCIYVTWFGLACPGCGATRMVLSMLQLDFRAAFGHNPMLFVLFFLWNAVALLYFLGRPGFVRQRGFLYGVLAVTMAALFVWGILRNLT